MALTKKELRKNRLDIEYKSETQKASIFLTFGTITLVGFLAYMLTESNYTVGLSASVLIGYFSNYYYSKAKHRMTAILSEIENL